MKTYLKVLYPLYLLLSSCTLVPLYSHVNIETDTRTFLNQEPEKEVPSGAYLASLNIEWKVDWQCRNRWIFTDRNFSTPINECPKNDNNFIGVAVSGGGSRSAVFSAAVLFELQRYGILQQVDVISSVSGGSFTAAYYALSCDRKETCPPTVEGPERFKWMPRETFKKLEKDFIAKWVSNWFWPENIVRFWFTHYDRTDVMVETLSDNLFDNSLLGGEGFRFHDLNPQRPYLIINATNYTSGNRGELGFTFTKETFKKLQSSLDQYPVANAVMSSATFPAVFNYTTLKDFSSKGQYIHLFDGGASDNLGLTSIEKILGGMKREENDANPRVLIILIDAFIPVTGKDSRDPDPRSFYDYFVDTNFLDAYDTLMAKLREDEVVRLKEWLSANNGRLLHIQFPDLEQEYSKIYEIVKNITTSLNITHDEATCLRNAARILVDKKMRELSNSNLRDLIQFPHSEGYALEECSDK